MDKRILSLFSICQKAGYIETGEEKCKNAIVSKSAKLIIVAIDASENTKKKFKNKSDYYKIPLFIKGNKEEISKAIGKENIATFVITNESLAKKIYSIIY